MRCCWGSQVAFSLGKWTLVGAEGEIGSCVAALGPLVLEVQKGKLRHRTSCGAVGCRVWLVAPFLLCPRGLERRWMPGASG